MLWKAISEQEHEIELEGLWHEPWEVLSMAYHELKENGKEVLSVIEHLGTAPLPTKYGAFHFAGFGDKMTGKEHVAFFMGDIVGENVLCRIHRSCVSSEIGGATNCDCPQQLDDAMKKIAQEGRGILIYLQDEGRGNGLKGKIAQLNGMFHWENDEIQYVTDTVTAFENAGYAGERGDYTAAVDILRFLGIKSVKLMTNNPDKIEALKKAGIPVSHRPHIMNDIDDVAKRDLAAKKKRLGHLI